MSRLRFSVPASNRRAVGAIVLRLCCMLRSTVPVRAFLLLAFTSLLPGTVVRAEPPVEAVEYFEREVRPLLAAHCFECHSQRENTAQGGLELDSSAGIAQGGDHGALVVAGQPEASLLLSVVRYEGEIQMPPDGRLTEQEVASLEFWIQNGAVLPAKYSADKAGKMTTREQARDYWAFRPAVKHPVATDADWVQTRIDAFTIAAMNARSIAPAPPADRRTLIRRLYYDLVGLPPTPEQVAAFVEDPSPTAFTKVVETLLASPAYGERWARVWLDKARYTDRTASWLEGTGEAYLYRDWVVSAFNADMPYDEFVRRQLATDLIDTTGPEDLPALGFLSLSPTYWKELKLPVEVIKVIVADEWEERVDAVSRTFLGLTVACARCHDHKFDPISSEDYYALAGVFASCRTAEQPTVDEAQYTPIRKAKEKVQQLRSRLEELKKAMPKPEDEIDDINAQIRQLENETPGYHLPMATALVEESLYVVRAGQTAQEGTRLDYRAEPRNLPLFRRGDPNRPGDIVTRGFIEVLSPDEGRLEFHQGSGRLELANAIVRDAASLAGRVIVNRIWQEHFGRGLVATPSNFGDQGERPTHPELLDDLTARFIEGGWSIKDLHREIVHSSTWQQSSSYDADKQAVDPENRYLARMNRRRLTFESWRDTMLYATNELEHRLGGPSIALEGTSNPRRTLYGTIHRREMPIVLQLHDFPDPTQHSPQRIATTTPLQGLYALNGPLLLEQADKLVQRLSQEHPEAGQARVERVYQLLFNRSPRPAERELAERFLADEQGQMNNLERWSQYAQVLLASNELLFVD